jgi:hypothetical protein
MRQVVFLVFALASGLLGQASQVPYDPINGEPTFSDVQIDYAYRRPYPSIRSVKFQNLMFRTFDKAGTLQWTFSLKNGSYSMRTAAITNTAVSNWTLSITSADQVQPVQNRYSFYYHGPPSEAVPARAGLPKSSRCPVAIYMLSRRWNGIRTFPLTNRRIHSIQGRTRLWSVQLTTYLAIRIAAFLLWT